VPAGVTGNATVQVQFNGVGSNTVTVPAAANSPGIFPVIENGVNYAGGVFLDGKRWAILRLARPSGMPNRET
jgi:uncharacterized protein (TIGR03437 family)